MSLDRARQLVAEGFERVKVQAVALPHTVWKVSMEVEFDRPLTLAEETVLRLVSAGVHDPGEMAHLMGLDAGVIVPATVVNLLQRQLLGQVERLEIMPLGRQALADQRTRQSKTYDVELRHDPYTNTFVWGFDGAELKDARHVRATLHVLPNAHELKPLDVEVRHAEVQTLLDRFGLPFEDRDTPKGQRRAQRDIIRLTANSSYQAWREATLEVWYNAERDEWDWRLLYGGGENREISAVLRTLQQDGVEILPLEAAPRFAPPTSEVGAAVHEVVEAARPRSKVIQTEEHRDALREAIHDARRELIIVSPWLTTAAVNDELVSWLGNALQRHRDLRVVIGYGIEQDDGTKQDRKAHDQRNALRRLNGLGQRHKGRLRTVEIGNTHEKLVITDGRTAIVTSFNWLSFNPRPGRGVRRETGIRVDDREEVQRLRGALAVALGLR
ncbi:MAG: hypothetical protein H6739_04730 [Alphaproteobacteria bacterium]|nr:hypothetical protein [Alphaproteobacteria bacterium]